MSTWPVHDAKARFSELLEACMTHGPQLVTKRGAKAAVLVPYHEWQRLAASAQPSLKDLLLSPAARTDDLALSPRGRSARRPLLTLD